MVSAVACGVPTTQLQIEALQSLVAKHVQDAGLAILPGGQGTTAKTSTERGLARWEQAHLIASLDLLNAYQRSRRARSPAAIGGMCPGFRKQFKDDPRTRLLELLKQWLRQNAGNTSVDEEEMRGFCSLCRDLLNHAKLFPARNPRSFIRTIAEVYEHLTWQLREQLEHDRTCADLSQRLTSLSRNLLSDAITYLLLGPTCLKQTDLLPSLEVVALWQSLPDEGHPFPSRIDLTQQDAMRDAWETQCGALIGAVLRAPWCVRFFDGTGAEEEARQASAAILKQHGSRTEDEASAAMRAIIEQIKLDFERGQFKKSGLAGAFRNPTRGVLRKLYLQAVELAFDLLYLLGEAFVHFQHISDSLGDYGSIRISAWLHPFLDTLAEKVQTFKTVLGQLNEAADEACVLARARGRAVEKPAPSNQMCARAHAAVERAVSGQTNHAQSLLQIIDALKARSAPERIPHVIEGLGETCVALQDVLTSPEFRARVGGTFPDLPPLCRIEAGPIALLASPSPVLDADCTAREKQQELPVCAAPHYDYECNRTPSLWRAARQLASASPDAMNEEPGIGCSHSSSRSASAPGYSAQGSRKRANSRPRSRVLSQN